MLAESDPKLTAQISTDIARLIFLDMINTPEAEVFNNLSKHGKIKHVDNVLWTLYRDAATEFLSIYTELFQGQNYELSAYGVAVHLDVLIKNQLRTQN